ncbi:MAG: HAD family hydrolase [Armatimonadota bacterium]
MAIILDMDGVLFDSEPVHIRAWQLLLAEMGKHFPDAWFHHWIGIADLETAEHLHQECGCAETSLELLLRKRRVFRELAIRDLQPFPGVVEGLTALSGRQVPLAVATSCIHEEAQVILQHTGLLRFFPVLVGFDDVAAAKPAPDPFLHAAELIGREPADCFIIEDSPTGVAGAYASGCTVLGVTTTHTADQLAQAHHIFTSTAEALAWAGERCG